MRLIYIIIVLIFYHKSYRKGELLARGKDEKNPSL